MQTATTDADLLISALTVLELMAEERSTYDRTGRETQDFSGLAAKVLMKDMEAMGEPATIPDPAAVARVEEQLDQLFTAAHVILYGYTSLGDV